ncbi:MAG: multidrug effflux MFS transporter [Pseudomonadota bacterium]
MFLPAASDRSQGRAPLALLVFLSLMTSVIALTIDAILPALDAISDDLSFEKPSDRQLIVLVVFAGMGLGQPIFGPLSDAIGRKQTAMIGWGIYIVGALVAVLASGIEGMLAGRFLQGVGAAGPRIVAAAIVRDLYEGRAMARIMSLIMAVFMLVPMLAPLIGQGLEILAGWRAIFTLYLAMAGVCVVWYLSAIPETLAPEHKRPLSLRPLAEAFIEVFRTRTTMLYTLASASIFGAFAAFLAGSQQVYEEIYELGHWFPALFAATGAVFAVAQLANSRLVMTLGMRRICKAAAGLVVVSAVALYAMGQIWYGPVPPFPVFFVGFIPIFVGSALMFSNLTALALDPLGHVAGTASAVVMSISTLVATPVGMYFASGIDGTVQPLLTAFALLGATSFAFILVADRGAPR